MAPLHQVATCLVLATCLAAAVSFRVKRQAQQPRGFTCPQPNGTFAFPDDCSKFYQCTNELATLLDCSQNLLFNSNSGLCDWPSVVIANPGDCTPPATDGNEHDLCAQQPSNIEQLLPGQAFYVAHPEVCNAFYTCGTGYLYAPCTMCPETMYFDGNLMACAPMYSNPPESFCNGLQYISHEDKELTRLEDICWPFANIPNPMLEQAEKVRNAGTGGGRPNNNNNNNNNNGWNRGNNNNRGDNRGGNRGTNRGTFGTPNNRFGRFGTQDAWVPYGRDARFWN